MAGQHCAEQSGMIRLPGADLRVEMRDGPSPTIFVHGFGGDLQSWDPLWALLPSGRGYVRYDLRGFGGSSALSNAWFHHADDLLNLLDALRIERCNLVGVSMGGSVALNFALSHPKRVQLVGLISPGLMAWEWSDEWQALWKPIVTAARSGDMIRAKAQWLAHPLFSTTRVSNAAGVLQDEVSRFAGRQWIEDRQAPALPDLERLHELKRNVLLLTGTADFADFHLIADLIEAAIPTVTRHDAADLGHLLHIEAPEWCRDKLAAMWVDHSLAS
jgi:pimeloyl-ACP methyl ester carboxylesterase